MSCVNCGAKGHIGSECTKPKVEFGKRPCFICNHTGHLARNCPNKPLKMLEDQALLVAMIMCMECGDDNFSKPKRPVPQPILLSDYVQKKVANSQPHSSNRFRPLTSKDLEGMEHPRGRVMPVLAVPEEIQGPYVKPMVPTQAKLRKNECVLIEQSDRYVLAENIGDMKSDVNVQSMMISEALTTKSCEKMNSGFYPLQHVMDGTLNSPDVSDGPPEIMPVATTTTPCTAPTLQEAFIGDTVATTKGQSLLTASSDDSPHTADDGRRDEVLSEQHAAKGNPSQPKPVRVVATEVERIERKEAENSQGHSLGETQDNSENRCSVDTLRSLGISSERLSQSLCEILGVGPDHPQVRKLMGIPTTASAKPKGQFVGRAWINCLEIEEGDEEPLEILAAGEEEYPEVEFEVALDSGSVVHVCANADTLGYLLEESAGSRRGQKFVMGDGGQLGNLGQKVLKLGSKECPDITSTFQIANVTRPLMSVGKICDEGLTVEFAKTRAVVLDANKKIVCIFERQPGGLYVAKMRLRAPGFVRQ